jgi:hypothetical protein
VHGSHNAENARDVRRRGTYSISALAHEFALTTRAIRFYEDEACSLRSVADAPGSITSASGCG